jgi:hypothetical protein
MVTGAKFEGLYDVVPARVNAVEPTMALQTRSAKGHSQVRWSQRGKAAPVDIRAEGAGEMSRVADAPKTMGLIP